MQDTGKYRVYSADEHRCMGKKTKFVFFIPDGKVFTVKEKEQYGGPIDKASSPTLVFLFFHLNHSMFNVETRLYKVETYKGMETAVVDNIKVTGTDFGLQECQKAYIQLRIQVSRCPKVDISLGKKKKDAKNSAVVLTNI